MKYLIIIISISLALIGCGSEDNLDALVSESPEAVISQPVIVGTPVTAQLHSNAKSQCLFLNYNSKGQMWCHGRHIAIQQYTPSYATFWVKYITSDYEFKSIANWDDTYCWEMDVLQRPVSRTPGTAFYCIGEGSLSVTVNQFDIIYSGPSYATAAHSDTGITEHSLYHPDKGNEQLLIMSAGDISLDTLINQNLFTPAIITDTKTETNAGTIKCSIDGQNLICTDFTINMEE